MNSKKRYLILALVPVAALLLSGCGKQTAPTSQTSQSTTQNAAQDQTQAAANSQGPQAVQKQKLEPLPTDGKQAIDGEINNITKDIDSTNNVSDSANLSNTDLGL